MNAAPSRPRFRVCVVCSGNICRSPMGEVVLRARLADAGLSEQVDVDSAGTGDWHIGQGADPRTVQALQIGGYDGSAHRARQFERSWFEDRDLILVADRRHLAAVRALAPARADHGHVRLLRSFDPAATAAGTLEVDDPYYGNDDGFARCLAEVERACDGVVEFIRDELS